MRGHDGEERWRRKQALVAVCNILPDSRENREAAYECGLLDVCLNLLSETTNEDHKMRKLAVACISNLSVEPRLKKAIGASHALKYLIRFVRSNTDDARMLQYSLAALWSVCMGHKRNKAFVHIQTGVHELLLSLCRHPDALVRRQACGCVYEMCCDNMKAAQEEFRYFGAEPTLSRLASGKLEGAGGGEQEEIEILEARRLAVATLQILCKNSAEWKAAGRTLGTPKSMGGSVLSVDEKV